MDIQVAIKALRLCDTLEGFDDAQRGYLLLLSTERGLAAGETLFSAGDATDGAFYLVAAGSVTVAGEAVHMPDTLYREGQMIGEIALLNPSHKRLRTVTANEPTQLLAWAEGDLTTKAPELFAHLRVCIERTGFERIARGF